MSMRVVPKCRPMGSLEKDKTAIFSGASQENWPVKEHSVGSYDYCTMYNVHVHVAIVGSSIKSMYM